MTNKLPLFSKEQTDLQFKDKTLGDWLIRVIVIPLIMLVGFGLLFVRLFHLTIIKGQYYKNLAMNNRIKEITLSSPRGKIIDRKGLLLASSIPIISKNQPARYKRNYASGTATAHIIGFRQIASQEDIDNDTCSSLLKKNDFVGKTGIERLFDCELRGVSGKQLVEVDASGHKKQTLATINPKKGKDLVLALDSELQQKTLEIILKNQIKTNVELNLPDYHIVVVASKPKTGEILLMLSYPTYNPQYFEDQNTQMIQTYLHDKELPLFNRVTQGTYPPGSVFKPVIVVGALEDKKIPYDFQIEDTGSIQAGPQKFGNWFFLKYGKTDGLVDIVKGLQRSNDIFFYKTGEALGVDGIKKWASRFGYGVRTNIGLPEANGIVPSNFWKKETLKERWYLGDTYNLSIGQGYLLATPLQVNQVTATLANRGVYCSPQLLKIAPENSHKNNICHSLKISSETLKLVEEGMKKACQTGGTAWPFFTFGASNLYSSTSATLLRNITIACKTGTAQTQQEDGLPHAWFTAYAPIKNPEIAITVMVDASGEGSSVAAPIAKAILEYYFSRVE